MNSLWIRRFIDLNQRTPQSLNWRQSKIGASDASVLVGKNKFGQTPGCPWPIRSTQYQNIMGAATLALLRQRRGQQYIFGDHEVIYLKYSLFANIVFQ